MNKLLNKKGSVLFLVIVVMSILIVAASATFFIINNQHSSVTVRYSSEQSYQTAFSVSNTVSNYIDGYLEAIGKSGKEMDEWGNTLIAKMLKMPSNTSSNVTSEFDLSSIGMGKADVVITKKIVKNDPVNPENFIHVFEITTTSEFNGETVSVTQVKEISTGPTEYFTRFLTSTGKRPEDVLFSSHSILSEAYFENEYTRLGGSAVGGAAFTHLNHSLYSLGTIYDTGIKYVEGTSKEIVVAQSYYITSTGGGSVYADEMYIGGDLINGGNGGFSATKAIFADNVYVLGNMEIGSNGVKDGVGTTYYVNGDCHIWCGTAGSKIYINGDLYLHDTNQGQGQFYVKGNVIFADAYGNGMGWSVAERIEYGKDVLMADGSSVDESSTQYTNKHFVHSPSMAAPFDDSKVTDVKNHINSSTKKNKYQVWDAEKYFNDTFNPSGTMQPLRLDDEDQPNVTRMNEYVDDYIVTIRESCMITPANAWGAGGYHNIFIDTSFYDKDIYIYLQPKSGSNTFSFSADGGAQNINIYVIGKHSVIFILPENANFTMDGQTFIGHIDVFAGLSNTNVSASSVLDDSWHSRAFTELSYLQGNGSRLENSLYLDPDDGATKFKPNAFEGDAHNNIFLVTKGTNNTIDFTAQSTFLGYVYAPSAIMTSGGGADGLGFIGGLIVGSYSYTTNAALAFTTPYDYYNCYPISKGTDIVKYLINFANAGGVGSPSGGDSATLQGWANVGYK